MGRIVAFADLGTLIGLISRRVVWLHGPLTPLGRKTSIKSSSDKVRAALLRFHSHAKIVECMQSMVIWFEKASNVRLNIRFYKYYLLLSALCGLCFFKSSMELYCHL